MTYEKPSNSSAFFCGKIGNKQAAGSRGKDFGDYESISKSPM